VDAVDHVAGQQQVPARMPRAAHAAEALVRALDRVARVHDPAEVRLEQHERRRERTRERRPERLDDRHEVVDERALAPHRLRAIVLARPVDAVREPARAAEAQVQAVDAAWRARSRAVK
jgi:hypothetical protein